MPDASAAVAAPREEGEAGLVPSEQELREQLRALVARKAPLCLVYAASSPAYYNYRVLLEKDLAAARAGGLVRVEALSDTDHVFTPLAAQQRLVEVVQSWCASVAEARGLLAPADQLP
jgi:hypothetical protein